MNFEELLSAWQKDERIRACARLAGKTNPGNHLVWSGLAGSAAGMAMSALYLNSRLNHIIVLENKDAAAYFQNDLSSILNKKDIFYFPDSFKRPGHFEQLNNNHILLRTESVNKFIKGDTRAEILVTYPEALFEKVVSRKVLDANTLHIQMKEKLDVDFIIDLLVTYGFERVDFVYEPGQFSIRGGIVDIFSFGNELPYRIELWDDEVESIRTFNPATQLSSRKIRQVTIIPNIQTHFKASEKTDLFEIIPKETLWWFSDLSFTLDLIRDLQARVFDILKELDREMLEEDHPFRSDGSHMPFTSAARWEEFLKGSSTLELSRKSIFPGSQSFAFQTEEQPAFNKNFELLSKALLENQKKGYGNYIFADNPKQIERFYQIFEDLNAGVNFTPVPLALSHGFVDHDHKSACYTDHQIFNRYHKYRIREAFSKSQALSLKALNELSPGDYVVHIDHGVGRFSGLEKIEVNGKAQEAVRLIYKDDDLLYVNINALHKISKYSSKDGKAPRINKLGSDAWEKLKRKTKRKVKDIADELIRLYAKRKAQKGHAFPPDNYLQTELEASFIYEDTPDQLKCTNEVKHDMEEPHPMDRLVCGDVGFGKTEIAIRAAFKAVADSKQVAILVPTTILAMQHYRTFTERLKDFPCTVDYINRFKSSAEKKKTLAALREGKVDIIIGTHSLIGKQVQFKDLGLLIIDEEQKFGVAAKEKLKNLKLNVDTLTLTATPIPRTLKFSLMGARDLSVINTPPPNRQPISTELHTFSDEILREAINHEFYRGGQVFFIHNRVKDIEDIALMISKLCPDVSIGVAHGQMEGQELEKHMLDFIAHKYDVLVSTNIIEAGLDIANANTIIINNAHQFGLSDLHQLRGRVGRSNKKAFCYLFAPPLSTLTMDARKRLKAIEQFADLGSGFQISMRDLDIRGAGNILGGEQSGFVAEIGFETYQKILNEAIRELKEGEYKELFAEQLKNQSEFVQEVLLESDFEMRIPEFYVSNTNERLSLYTQLNAIKTEAGLQRFKEELTDRFGPLPAATQTLIEAIRLQWEARKLGFERLLLKQNQMQGVFISNRDSHFFDSAHFAGILDYVQAHPARYRLRQSAKNLALIVKDVRNMEQALFQLQQLRQFAERARNESTEQH